MCLMFIVPKKHHAKCEVNKKQRNYKATKLTTLSADVAMCTVKIFMGGRNGGGGSSEGYLNLGGHLGAFPRTS